MYVYQVNIIKKVQIQKYTQLNFYCEISMKNVYVWLYFKIIETRKQIKQYNVANQHIGLRVVVLWKQVKIITTALVAKQKHTYVSPAYQLKALNQGIS